MNHRYVVVKTPYWYRIKVGDGEQLIGKFYTKDGAQAIVDQLERAFNDGIFVGSKQSIFALKETP